MSRVVHLLVLIICFSRAEGQSEGETCYLNGVAALCKNINNCPSAINDLKNRIFPQRCSFSNSDPIVCCADTATGAPAPTTTTLRAPVATTSSPPKATSTTEETLVYNDYTTIEEATCSPLPATQTAPKTGQKAWDKCVEYQDQYVFPCAPSVALVGGKERVNNCKHNANQLIINGVDAEEAEFPHMALLGFGEESSIVFQCGGSIISENFILTAGHCTYAKGIGPVTFALVGTLRRSKTFDRQKLYRVQHIHKHIEYAPPSRYNDIALLQTDRRIKLNAFVVPACLDTGAQAAPAALATGWGALVNGSIANVLQKVKIYQFNGTDCSDRVRPNRVLRAGINDTTQVCYGDSQQSHDTCQGDSGGPLQIYSSRIKCMYVVVGVTSFGRQCGVVGEPGVYTRVRPYLSWIESVVWP